MLSKLRESFKGLLEGVAKLAYQAGLKPNWLTLGSLALMIAAAALYICLIPVLAGAVLLLAGFFDSIDGALARISGHVTKFGSFLDSTCDRLGDAFAICGVVVAGLCRLEWGLAALVGSLIVSYVRARSESLGLSLAGVGVGERAERILVLGSASMLVPLWPPAIELGVALIAILCAITIAQRVSYVYKRLEKSLS